MDQGKRRAGVDQRRRQAQRVARRRPIGEALTVAHDTGQ